MTLALVGMLMMENEFMVALLFNKLVPARSPKHLLAGLFRKIKCSYPPR